MCAREGLCVVTGGPGTGKTTVMREVVARLRAAGERVVLAAPTGVARQVLLRAMAGVDPRPRAMTLHRLVARPPAGRLLSVVVDEASLLSLEMLREVLVAFGGARPALRRLVLVGDPDQLPPVNGAEVLWEMLRCARVPRVALTHVYRQAHSSALFAALQLSLIHI